MPFDPSTNSHMLFELSLEVLLMTMLSRTNVCSKSKMKKEFMVSHCQKISRKLRVKQFAYITNEIRRRLLKRIIRSGTSDARVVLAKAQVPNFKNVRFFCPH